MFDDVFVIHSRHKLTNRDHWDLPGGCLCLLVIRAYVKLIYTYFNAYQSIKRQWNDMLLTYTGCTYKQTWGYLQTQTLIPVIQQHVVADRCAHEPHNNKNWWGIKLLLETCFNLFSLSLLWERSGKKFEYFYFRQTWGGECVLMKTTQLYASLGCA